MHAGPRSGTLVAVGVGLLVLVGTVGYHLRQRLGLSDSPAELVAMVQAHGWRGQMLFLGLVTFRQFLAIPAGLILVAGGLCFGAALGTLLGAVGIVISGLAKFGLTRTIGRRWLGARLGKLERRAERLGPAVIGISTAHPFGILAPLHWAAGLSPVRPAPFALALCLGAPVRAFAYSAFGATLSDTGSPAFWIASGALVAALVVPLVMTDLRTRLWRLLAQE
jgi:uncharacterized membrane protein YdjX (TVP38/TMEM64 family)